MTDEAPKTRTTTWKRRLSIVCYLTAVSVAMVGWLSAFAWLTVAIAKWLLP
jgi:ABC-type enterochelin transport system permease subunit